VEEAGTQATAEAVRAAGVQPQSSNGNGPQTGDSDEAASPDWASLWPWFRRHLLNLLSAFAWVTLLAGYGYMLWCWWGYTGADVVRVTEATDSASRLLVGIAYLTFLARTFAFHVGLVMLPALLVVLLRRRWWQVAAFAPVLIYLLGPDLHSMMPPQVGIAAKPGTPVLRVMTINLLGINQDHAGMIAEIQAADPDVLILQEYRPHWDEALVAALGSTYPYRVREPRPGNFGAATFSKLPMVGVPEVRERVEGYAPEIWAVFDWEGHNVTVVNVHLLPPGSSIFRPMCVQVDALRDDLAAWQEQHRSASPGSEPLMIVGGDFNATPRSWVQDAVTVYLDDAFEIAGQGRGCTWPARGRLRVAPGIRIDRIFCDAPLCPIKCEVGEGPGSDHRPIVAEFVYVDR
jgi:endonuclease/exonuclease/phosphatase (EEP) superfamily protein YafD